MPGADLLRTGMPDLWTKVANPSRISRQAGVCQHCQGKLTATDTFSRGNPDGDGSAILDRRANELLESVALWQSSGESGDMH